MVITIVAALAIAMPVAAAAYTLPDEPGAIATSDVGAVCAPGYASSVRPRGRQWRAIKRVLYARDHVPRGHRYGLVGDHIIPLELGGSPTDLRNLWLQPYGEAHAKDRVEDELAILVCDHRLALSDAQNRIARKWTTAVPQSIVLTARERARLDRESQSDY